MLGKRGLAGALAVGLGALALLAPGGREELAADERPAKEALPADLALVPASGMVFASINVGALWNSDVGKTVRDKLGKDVGLMVKGAKDELGVGPGDIERLSMVVVEPRTEPLRFVRTRAAYDRRKVREAVLPGGSEEKYRGKSVYVGQRDRALWLIDGRTFVAGPFANLKSLIDREDAKEGPLSLAVRVAAKHSITVGLNPVRFGKVVGPELPAVAAPFKPLLRARSAVFTLDVGAVVRATLAVEHANVKDARTSEKVLKAALQLGLVALGAGIEEMEKQKAPAALVALLRKGEAGLKDARITQEDYTVTARASVKVETKAFVVAALEAIQKVRQAAGRAQTQNNLKQIGLAMHGYHDTHGALPPAAIYDKKGKALLSWRVLILPYVEQDALYKEFKLNEPWDSDHNKKLIARMPRVYADPGAPAPAGHTYYQVFVGPQTMFEGKRGLRFTDVTDGTSNTILTVEAAKAVPWTKPEDVPFDPGQPVPAVASFWSGGFNAGFADGSVRFFAKRPAEATLRAFITRNGGEVIAE